MDLFLRISPVLNWTDVLHIAVDIFLTKTGTSVTNAHTQPTHALFDMHDVTHPSHTLTL